MSVFTTFPNGFVRHQKKEKCTNCNHREVEFIHHMPKERRVFFIYIGADSIDLDGLQNPFYEPYRCELYGEGM